MTDAQLAAFNARMTARAAREAATPPPATPRPTPPMPPTGARPCRACAGTGYVGDSMVARKCPSCMGAGWKWTGAPAYNPSAGTTCRFCKQRDAGDPCADCLNNQQAT